eukprot:5412648-Prymnesium_polylepis.1
MAGREGGCATPRGQARRAASAHPNALLDEARLVRLRVGLELLERLRGLPVDRLDPRVVARRLAVAQRHQL